MKQLLIICMLYGVSISLAAQPNRPEVSLHYGISNYQGDLVPNRFFVLGESNFAINAHIGVPVHPNFIIRAGVHYMELSGSDLNHEPWRDKDPFQRFTTTLYEMSAHVEWYPLRPPRLLIYNEEELATQENIYREPGRYTVDGFKISEEKNGFYVVQKELGARILYNSRGSEWVFDPSGNLMSYKYKDAFRPFLFVGGGWVRFDARAQSVRKDGGSVPAEPQLDRERLAVPFGGGVRYSFHDNWSLEGILGWRYINTDYLDGLSQTRNPEANDWYFFAGIGANYMIGKSPQPQLAPADTDKDGTPDIADECPYSFGLPELQGCPDLDNDGIRDTQDECPDQAGPITNGGCPLIDTDGDGVLDENDQCPQIAGVPRLRGCPEKDQDEDGVPDDQDECPLVVGQVDLNGCPDADGDGIPDYRDDCPDEYGLNDYNGCPVSNEGQVTQLLNGIPSVRFELGSSELGPAGRSVLNRVASFLRSYPQYKLQITGYADDYTDETDNERISRQRANLCRQFLMARNVSCQRVFYEGLGNTDPVVPNAKYSNRLNRRVTFQLFR
ncbi:MAG: OmpA family protein [Saprospiraceae bacterium]|nr:OmpA family protein [Saprospiraceae bacterium]